VAVEKLKSSDPYPFTETIDYTVLCCGNVEINSNKFYVAELQRDPTTGGYRVWTNYGRIGNTNVYESRGPWYDEDSARRVYEDIVRKKQKGKSKGASKYEVVETICPTVGSDNIRGKSVTYASTSIAPEVIIQKSEAKYEADVLGLLRQFAQENIHKIQSSTSISFTSRGMETALGPVTETHVRRARLALDTIKDYLESMGSRPEQELIHANNLFFSLIPHPFGRKIQESDMVSSDSKLIEKYDLLDQLAAAVQLGINEDTEAEEFKQLDTDIVMIDQSSVAYREMVYAVEQSRKHRDLESWKVKSIYEIKIQRERERFEKQGDPLGNYLDLFHGSQNGNLLSILLNGLIIPPHNASHVTGRMFGNGIYGANSSTKSLNYSVGYWSGRRNKFDNVFLFKVLFAMGKTYESSSSLRSGAPSGYHSVTAYARKTGLKNDEFIVYSLPQCTITHLIELKQ
jgi:poly [ADP-ribose] polymerase 2/3/4